MGAASPKFREVARWTVVRTCVRTTVTGRGHPEPRKRTRRGSRGDRIDIRSTPAEKTRWQREADRYKVSLSELVRLKLDGGKVRVNAVADPALIEELRRHGNNLNQLVHAVHGGLLLDVGRIEAVLDALHQLYRREIARG
jgi:hypothetical protein